MKKTSRSHHTSLNELNITPLLDLVFVLLVIFIITTPQMMNNLEMSLPSGNPPKSKDKPKINRIDVDTKGQIFLNGLAVSMPDFRAQLEEIKSQDSNPNAVINGADGVDYQHIINVLDTLSQLNITNVGLVMEE
jgi:biopolymer transport protein ExbD